MGRIEEIREYLSYFIESEKNYSLNPDDEKYKDDVSFLLSRLQIAEEAFQKIVDESACKGKNCSYGDTCYAVISREALEQIRRD